MLRCPPHHCTYKAREVLAAVWIIKPLRQRPSPAQDASAHSHRQMFARLCLLPGPHLTLHVTLAFLVRLGRLTGVVLTSVCSHRRGTWSSAMGISLCCSSWCLRADAAAQMNDICVTTLQLMPMQWARPDFLIQTLARLD